MLIESDLSNCKLDDTLSIVETNASDCFRLQKTECLPILSKEDYNTKDCKTMKKKNEHEDTANFTNVEDVRPKRHYTDVELFAGAGGLALGLEFAGFDNRLCIEFDKDACQTLK